MTDFVAVVVTGVGTLLLRASFVVALAKRHISDTALRVLELVGPSVLGALTIALLIDPEGGLTVGVAEISGLISGGLVAYKTRNLVLMVVVGMVVYWVISAVM
jgi:branched-subunit amino acid transport protein